MADTRYEPDALYAVLHGPEWHLAYWRDDGVFEVIDNWQHGDRWKPEWIDRVVLVERSKGWADAVHNNETQPEDQ